MSERWTVRSNLEATKALITGDASKCLRSNYSYDCIVLLELDFSAPLNLVSLNLGLNERSNELGGKGGDTSVKRGVVPITLLCTATEEKRTRCSISFYSYLVEQSRIQSALCHKKFLQPFQKDPPLFQHDRFMVTFTRSGCIFVVLVLFL